ncbi:MAG: exodeoxyribonuclease V subunit beta [Gammaproteobacteria bacterium]
MTTAFAPLDLFAAPLSGMSLIEASAGTGKTYTITGLYLRLILEAERRVDQILVVTFTNAATEELKARIRQRLADVRAALQSGHPPDPFCAQLLERIADRERALRRVGNAVRGFDEAAIFTIHGFCRRVLAERAFASRMPFETEVLADTRDLLLEITEDFWRRTFHDASPLLVDYLLSSKHNAPSKLLQQIHPHLGKPYLKVTGVADPAQLAAVEAVYTDAFRGVRERWPMEREAVSDILLNDPGLNRQKYNPKSIPNWIEQLNTYLDLPLPAPQLPEKFAQFSAATIAKSLRQNSQPPRHPFFDACDALAAAHAALVAQYEVGFKALRARLLEFCNQELAARKWRERVQSYDDFLTNLQRALAGERGQGLAQMLRKRFPAALIDEFQDTDPIQYDILRRIYAESNLPVFIVGDPKQAIYSFRGADIFAYLGAQADAARGFTLLDNWRSEPALIDAVNTLFAHSRQAPFLFERIGFHHARAADQERLPLRLADSAPEPLQLWFLADADDTKPLALGAAEQRAARATAAEIARLLNLAAHGKATLGERVLVGGDIAVLVAKHKQGALVRRELLKLNVPSVQHAQDNVFDTHEADELERVLLALAEPGREALVRAALATDMFGLDAARLLALGTDERTWEQWLERFHRYHEWWRDKGFILAFQALLRDNQVSQRLLAFGDGERRLTNLLHLAELLHGAASQQRLGMAGLLKWLAERRQGSNTQDETLQLRLESDAQLVQIVTVHKSKGLEYPIVFCPFLWSGKLSAGKDEIVRYHDPADGYRAVLDIGSPELDARRPLAKREELAERLRQLYVALTRARHRCYLAWGKLKDAGAAPLAWLLHEPPVIAPDADRLDALSAHYEAMTATALRAELVRVAARAPAAIAIADLPAQADPYRAPAQAQSDYRPRSFPGPLRGGWRVGSFTALTANFNADAPDYDALVLDTPQTVRTERSIHAFPRGARPGSCLHQIFERWDFTSSDRAALGTLVETTLSAHGFEREWRDTIAAMVERVLATPLDEAGVCLRQIGSAQRVNEVEFYYPLAAIGADGLRQVLARHGGWSEAIRSEIERLGFAPLQGYMKGYIDLLFSAGGRYYLADYKSNWLGMTSADYRHENLVEAMAREAYFLQYLIYTVAVHRYLRLRLPGYRYSRDFGGVFYLFLRGMDPAHPGCGVYHDRPAEALIDALDAYLDSGHVG